MWDSRYCLRYSLNFFNPVVIWNYKGTFYEMVKLPWIAATNRLLFVSSMSEKLVPCSEGIYQTTTEQEKPPIAQMSGKSLK